MFHVHGYCNKGDQCLYLHNEVILLDKKDTKNFEFNELFQFFFDKKYQANYSYRLELITIE